MLNPQPDTFMFLLTDQVSSNSFKYPQLQGGVHILCHIVYGCVILCYVILCHVMYITCYVILCMDVWIDGWMDVNVNNRIEMLC